MSHIPPCCDTNRLDQTNTLHQKGPAMRYRETGQVHMDFHRTTNATLTYLREKYGQDFVDEITRRTARAVYRAIHQDLQQGNPEHLVEHWTYFFDREQGQYELQRADGEIRFIVKRCPAVAYLQEKGLPIDPHFCRQTVVLNHALAQDTPFQIETDVQGNGRCVQTIRRTQP